MLVGWGIPWPFSKHMCWAPGARGWILWVPLAIMCAESLVSLVPVIFEIVHIKIRHPYFRPLSAGEADAGKESSGCEREGRLVPTRWVMWGLAGSPVLGTALVWLVFGDEGIQA